MKQFRILSMASAALVLAAAATSCDRRPDVVGSWTGIPQPLNEVQGAFTANTIDVLNFSAPADGSQAGKIVISSMLSAQQTLAPTPEVVSPYQETVAGTASISGTWTFSHDDDDDISVVLDYSTLTVNIDPNGVAFSENLISGREQAQVDSLTASAVSRWQSSLYEALKPYYARYIKIDDIHIKDNKMTAEVADNDLHFAKELAQ